jgi:hypothetical protein
MNIKLYQLEERYFLSQLLIIDAKDMQPKNHYKKVYEFTIVDLKKTELELLENLFEMFNVDHPEDFKGRSMSSTDVIEIDGQLYLCKSMGWEKIEWKKDEIA